MWRRIALSSLSIGLLLVLGLSGHVAAQTGHTFGEITGRVVDAEGGVLPGVVVTLSGAAIMGEHTAVTNERGVYRFPAVPPGVCTLRFQLAGFSTFVREGLVVAVRSTMTQNVTLALAALEETVTVSGASPVVDVESAKTGQRLDAETLEAVPTSRSAFGTVPMLPGVVAGSHDVGGLSAADFTSMGTHGQEGYNFNFMGVVADSFQGNGAMYYLDYNSIQEISVDTAGMGADVGGGGGANINIIPKSGSNEFSGSAYFNGTGKNLAWSNVDDSVRARGIVGEGSLPLRVTDIQGDAGGPLKRDRVWLYGSVRDFTLYESIDGYPTDHLSRVRNYTFRGDVQLNQANHLTVFYPPNYKLLPNRFAAFNRPPESTIHQMSPKHLVNATWTSVATDRTMFEIGGSVYVQRINRNYSDEWHALSQPLPTFQDLTTDVFSGAHDSGVQLQFNDRFQVKAALTHYRDGWLRGNHQIKTGTEFSLGRTNETAERFGDTTFRFRNGVPDSIQVFNTPVVTETSARSVSAFVQDRISYNRVTLNIGLRYSFYDGWLPEQEGGGGQWVPKETFRRLEPAFAWSNFAPRAGVILRLTADGRNLIKANYGRYYDHLYNGHFSLLNPNVGRSIATYRWFGDLNGNGVANAGEYDPQALSVFVARRNSIDPDLQQPKTDEMTFAYERELVPNVGLNVSWIQRWYGDNWADVNVGVPLEAYTPVDISDPGPDNITGTADDRTITMFNRSVAFLGEDAFHRQTVPGGTNYKGLELTVNKHMANRWQMMGSYVWSRHEGPITSQASLSGVRSLPDPNNPNVQIHSQGRAANDQPHAFKLAASYQGPWGLGLGANLQVLSGLPRDRTVQGSLTQGTTTVRAEPRGTYRQDTIKLLSLKLDKHVGLPKGIRLSGFVEIHNLLNSSAASDFGSLTRGFASQAALEAASRGTTSYFGRVTTILAPRIAKFGARLTF